MPQFAEAPQLKARTYNKVIPPPTIAEFDETDAALRTSLLNLVTIVCSATELELGTLAGLTIVVVRTAPEPRCIKVQMHHA